MSARGNYLIHEKAFMPKTVMTRENWPVFCILRHTYHWSMSCNGPASSSNTAMKQPLWETLAVILKLMANNTATVRLKAKFLLTHLELYVTAMSILQALRGRFLTSFTLTETVTLTIRPLLIRKWYMHYSLSMIARNWMNESVKYYNNGYKQTQILYATIAKGHFLRYPAIVNLGF